MSLARDALINHVHTLLESGALTGVADSRIQTAVFDIIPTHPGFEPHEIVETEKGVEGTYFWHWEHLFDTNPDHSTVVETMTDLLIGQGFALSKTTPAEAERWEEWKKISGFNETIAVLIRDMFRVGNLMGRIYRKTRNVMDLRIQPIPVRGTYPLFDESQTEVLGWGYIPPDGKSHFDPWTELGRPTSHIQPIVLDPADLMTVSINRLPGVVYGRAVNYQAFGEYVGLKDLHRVAGVIAARQTSRFIHWTVDPEGLATQHEEKSIDPKKRKDSPLVQYMKMVRDLVSTRVIINQDTGETRITDNIITEDRVKGTDLTGDTNLKGLTETIETFRRTVSRKARIPPVFLATPDSSNRATSYNELVVFVIMMKGFFRLVAREMERVLLPELRLSGEIVPEEEVIQEDEAVKGEMIKALLDAWDRGIIKKAEVREQLERLLTIGLSPLPEGEEEGDFPEPAEDAPPEEEEPPGG